LAKRRDRPVGKMGIALAHREAGSGIPTAGFRAATRDTRPSTPDGADPFQEME